MRARIYRALQSSLGDALPPVRWTKDLLLFVNEMLGRPLSAAEERAERRAGRARRAERRAAVLVADGAARSDAPAAAVGADPSVVICVDRRSTRELGRIVNVLRHRSIPYRELDVERDHAARSWLMGRSRSRELPIVFIHGQPVGGYHELVRLDVSGRLSRMAHR